MFEVIIDKDNLLPALTLIAGAVDKKQSLMILSHVLLDIAHDKLSLTATDLELEISVRLSSPSRESGKLALPAKKLIDIIKSLEPGPVTIQADARTTTLKSGLGVFKLAILPPDDFPAEPQEEYAFLHQFSKKDLIQLLDVTHFAIAQNDHRAYLSTLLFELNASTVTTVSTDGHRMAISQISTDMNVPFQQYLLPRKSVIEILKLLHAIADDVFEVRAGTGFFSLSSDTITLSTKLVESRYPHYRKAIPVDNDKHILIDRDLLKRALSRVTVLAHEKTKAVYFQTINNRLSLTANNQTQDEASELLDAHVDAQDITIYFNAHYLLEVLQYIPEGLVRISLSTMQNSILVESLQNEFFQYIMMPLTI